MIKLPHIYLDRSRSLSDPGSWSADKTRWYKECKDGYGKVEEAPLGKARVVQLEDYYTTPSVRGISY